MEVSGVCAGDGGPYAAVLPRLVQETELQKMLADEKMRSDKHKTNYQMLKAEHTRLQDEYTALQKELKSTIEDSRLIQEKYTKLLDDARAELAAKVTENEQLRTQVVNPKMMESLKQQIQVDMEKPFREKVAEIDGELDKSRSDYKKLKYDYTFLKLEFEHQSAEHKRVVNEMTLRYEAEVSNLRREREEMVARQQQESTTDAAHVRAVQRENVQLNLKVKSLLAELEEIRSQREHVGMQADNVTRLQVKQLADLSASIKALETEKQSLRSQCEALQQEQVISNEENSRLALRTHELEKENAALRGRTEEAVHRGKLDASNVRVEMLRERGDIERERDRLHSQLQDTLAEVDVLKHTASQLEECIVDKERDVQRRVQAVREEEWQKLHKVESERLDLESKVHELEKRRADFDAARIDAVEKAEERVKKALEQKDAAEREALVVRTKLENQLQTLDALERERADNTELRGRLQRLDAQYNAFVSGEQELLELNERLEHDIDELRSELDNLRGSSQRDREQADQLVASSRSAWMDEKCHLQSRIDELDVQLAAAVKKLSIATASYKQKKGRMKSLVMKLRDRVASLQLKVDQLQIDKEALKRSLPADAHEQLKRRLFDLLQRNREFRSLLLAGNIVPTQVGGLTFGALATDDDQLDVLPSPGKFFDMKQRDVMQLRDRVDHLDSQQRHQLEELRSAPTYVVDRSGGPLHISDHYSDSPAGSIHSDRSSR